MLFADQLTVRPEIHHLVGIGKYYDIAVRSDLGIQEHRVFARPAAARTDVGAESAVLAEIKDATRPAVRQDITVSAQFQGRTGAEQEGGACLQLDQFDALDHIREGGDCIGLLYKDRLGLYTRLLTTNDHQGNGQDVKSISHEGKKCLS